MTRRGWQRERRTNIIKKAPGEESAGAFLLIRGLFFPRFFVAP